MSRTVVKSHVVTLACMVVAPLLGVRAQTRPAATFSRDSITSRLADLRRIHTPEGIEALEQVDVGGTKQWISIRGLNKANPVLLVIHGGPGSPLMGSSWAFQKPWEDFFTVVEWEQRGVGKNFVGTDTAVVGKTLSNERLTQDAEEIVAYLRQRLHKDKIVVMGFSWGTIIGTRLARRRPEWLHAYVDAHLPALRWAEEHVIKDADVDTRTVRRAPFKVPVILMMGKYDLHTPHDAAKAYFGRIEAPTKKFITFERSAHFIMFEEPGQFLLALVNEVLPLTGERAAFTRLP